jgi:hypothetical protein
MQLTSLEELRGRVYNYTSASAQGVTLTTSRPLLLPRLRCLALYMYNDDGTWPALTAPLEALMAAAPSLQELAVHLVGPMPGKAAGGGGCAIVFPRLRRLHVSIRERPLPADPVGVARMFPSLTELVFGHGSPQTPLRHYPFAALPLLPLQRFSLDGCEGPAPEGGAYTHLARCSALTSLVLSNIQGISVEDALQAARAPRLRKLVVARCAFEDPQSTKGRVEDALHAAVAGLDLTVTWCSWDTTLLPPD